MGQSSSLSAGLAQAASDSDGYLFALGDQPLLMASFVDRLIETFRSAHPKPLAVVPFYKGRRGNPVLISSTLLEELRELKGDEGARKILRRIQTESPDLFVALEVENEQIFWDLDTEADFEKIRSQVQLREKGRN
jgi:molybdenum cofactor cytidylyltransferase